MLGQLKQIVGICHRSCPRFFLQSCLLGLAAVIKIGEDAPLFEGLELLDNRSFYLARGVPELIPAAGSLGEDDSEKDRRLPSPILSEGVPQTHNVGAQALLDSVDGLVEFRLLRKRLGNVHNLIRARLGGREVLVFRGGGDVGSGAQFRTLLPTSGHPPTSEVPRL